MSSFLQPHGLKPARLLCPWDFPGQNTGVGSHSSPLQGIFLTQGLNPHFLLGRQILYHWATREALFVQKGENTGLAKKFRFFHNIVQKNPNEHFAQPSTHLESLWKDIQKIADARGCYRGERGRERTSHTSNSEYRALSRNTKTKRPHLRLSWELACVRLLSCFGAVSCFLFLVIPCYCYSFFPFPSFLRLVESCYLFPPADGKSVPICASLACWQRRFRGPSLNQTQNRTPRGRQRRREPRSRNLRFRLSPGRGNRGRLRSVPSRESTLTFPSTF